LTKYRYTMKVSPDKLLDIIETAVGRRPDGMGKSGLHTWSFDFDDTDITAQNRDDALAAFPEAIRFLYSFEREVIEE